MAPPEKREGRPRTGPATSENYNGDPSLPPGAELAMRCALLRVRAERAHRLDPSGWLSAQLLDLADLLESAEERGWFA